MAAMLGVFYLGLVIGLLIGGVAGQWKAADSEIEGTKSGHSDGHPV